MLKNDLNSIFYSTCYSYKETLTLFSSRRELEFQQGQKGHYVTSMSIKGDGFHLTSSPGTFALGRAML